MSEDAFSLATGLGTILTATRYCPLNSFVLGLRRPRPVQSDPTFQRSKSLDRWGSRRTRGERDGGARVRAATLAEEYGEALLRDATRNGLGKLVGPLRTRGGERAGSGVERVTRERRKSSYSS